jgi:thiol-disulfide isomerase/thioredoxin
MRKHNKRNGRGSSVRAVACLGLVACCLALAGCSSTGKKSPNAAAAPAGQQAAPRPAAGTGPIAANTTDPRAAVPVSATTGLLAGQVIDTFNHKPPTTYIQVVQVRDSGEPAGAPIDVAADAQGYFTIQGLEPGKHYQLWARAQDNDHKLAGTTWATPPNPRVVIRVSEEFVTPNMPPLPGPPNPPGAGSAPAPDWSTPGSGGAGQNWAPVPRPPTGTVPGTPPRSAGIGAPVATDPGTVPVRPENLISINPQVPNNGVPAVPTRVPSCVLTGQYLVNFALNDLTGQPWEFKKHHSRLTLVDFWETACIPCQHAIPHLNALNDRYGPRGLQVVGIAYEDGSPAAQAEKVERVRTRLKIKYQLLLGGGDGGPCPVYTQFGIHAYPTLVLLDDTGRILWRSEGLERQQLSELETILRQRLGR